MAEHVPFKILLVDDHRLFNDGINRLLSDQPDLVVCGQVFEHKEIPFALQQHNPELILLDLNLQGRSGIEIGKQILSLRPQIKVLILTMYALPKLQDEARKAGFQGYLRKDARTDELLNGIRKVKDGHTCFDQRIDTQPMMTTTAPFGDDFVLRANLTFRELEVIRLIREGLTSEQIADRLFLSLFTVKTHRRNIYFKLSINNVVELIEFANRNGL